MNVENNNAKCNAHFHVIEPFHIGTNYVDFSHLVRMVRMADSMSLLTRILLGMMHAIVCILQINPNCDLCGCSRKTSLVPSWWFPLVGDTQWLYRCDEAQRYPLDIKTDPGNTHCLVNDSNVFYRIPLYCRASTCVSKGDVGDFARLWKLVYGPTLHCQWITETHTHML